MYLTLSFHLFHDSLQGRPFSHHGSCKSLSLDKVPHQVSLSWDCFHPTCVVSVVWSSQSHCLGLLRFIVFFDLWLMCSANSTYSGLPHSSLLFESLQAVTKSSFIWRIWSLWGCATSHDYNFQPHLGPYFSIIHFLISGQFCLSYFYSSPSWSSTCIIANWGAY